MTHWEDGWSRFGFHEMYSWDPPTAPYVGLRYDESANVLTIAGKVMPVKRGEMDTNWVIQP